MKGEKIQLKSFPLFHRRACIEVFTKFTTSILIAAAVERFFSLDSDIFRPKRSNLTSQNFYSH